MNIIHLSSERTWRGGEQQIAYLVDELNMLNVNNYVVCKKGSAFEKYCIEKNLKFISIPFSNQFDILSSIYLKNISKKINAEIIHVHSSKSHSIAVWSYFIGNRTPLVLSRKVDFPISKNFLSKIKYSCRGIKKIICVSNAIKKITQKDLPNNDLFEVIYDGIDTLKYENADRNYLRREYNISEDKTIIANTSALADHKDYPTYIRMINNLHDKIKAHYFIIGEGPEEENIKNLVKEYGLQELITFTGFRKDINKILPSIDYFVITSKTEGLGSSILDAYSAQVPVIATNAGGIPEIVTHNETAMLSDVYDDKSLSEHIIDLVNNPEKKIRLVNNAKSYVANFSKKIMAAKTLEVYRSVSSSK